MAQAVPSTPQTDKAANPSVSRRLWASPAFSDYFSGDDASSWSFSPEASVLKSVSSLSDAPRASSPDIYGGRTLQNSVHGSQISQSSPGQRKLLHRLNSIGQSILSSQFDNDQCAKLDVDIDRMESTIAAPDSQSRAPAEDEITGLFNDDVTETSTVVQEPELNNREALALVHRVTRAAADLKQRFLEIKHTNDIATNKLEAAAQEISLLRKENLDLRNSDSQSEILYLRLRLNALEERARSHLDRKGQEDLLDKIGQLNLTTSPYSKASDGRTYSVRSTAYSDDVFVDDSRPSDGLGYRIMRSHSSKTSSRQLHSLSTGSVYTNGQVTPIAETNDDHDDLLVSPVEGQNEAVLNENRSNGPVALDAAPTGANGPLLNSDGEFASEITVEEQIPSSETKGLMVNGEDQAESSAKHQTPALEKKETNNSASAEQMRKEEEENTRPEPQPAGKARENPRKSPWQMLWNDLAEFSGIHHESDEEEDNGLIY